MAEDVYGLAIEIGDKVVANKGKYAYLGIVQGFTPKMVRVKILQSTYGSMACNEALVTIYPDEMFVITKAEDI